MHQVSARGSASLVMSVALFAFALHAGCRGVVDDASPDGAPNSEVPQIPDNNAFAAGQAYTLRFDAESLSCSCAEVADHDLLLTLHDDPALGVTAWIDYAGSTSGPVLAAEGVVPGRPLVLSTDDHDFGFSPGICDGWSITIGTMTIEESAAGIDGLPASLAGTMAGGHLETDEDNTSEDPFSGTLTGARDTTASTASLYLVGSWPELEVVASFSESVATSDVEQALALTIDGAPQAFTLLPRLLGAAGRARGFTIVPSEPLQAGATVAATLAPVADFAGNLSDTPAPLALTVAALAPTVTSDWDFSGGDPFTEGMAVQIVSSFANIKAPSGGAMAVSKAHYESSTWASPVGADVQIPAGAKKLRVALAVLTEATPETDDEHPDRQIALLVASGIRTASFPEQSGWTEATVAVGEVAHLFSGFETLEIDVSDLAGSLGRLHIGHPEAPSGYCANIPFSEGDEHHLIDRIWFE